MTKTKPTKTAERKRLKNGRIAFDGRDGVKTRFSAEHQPSREARSRGQIEGNARRRIVERMAAAIEAHNLDGLTVDKVFEMIENATDPALLVKAVELAIKAIAVAKDDKQTLELATKGDFFAELTLKVKSYEGRDKGSNQE